MDPAADSTDVLLNEIRGCRVCAGSLALGPRPIVQFSASSRGAGASGDLPPRPECAPLWHERILAALPPDRLTLLVGAYVQRRYLNGAKRQTRTDIVRDFASCGPAFFPLPHPSWRSGIRMQRNPWFERDVVPVLQARVSAALGG